MSSGRRLGDRYVIETPLGTGSMGVVYRALDEQTGAKVAIKLLKSLDASDIERFDREFAIVSKLSHPAIVPSWGASKTSDGEAYFVMEWLEGESLRERLRRAELSLGETVTLVRRILGGLAHAHAHGVVHRDVKPANIFLVGGRAEQAKLLDFGIARRLAAGDTLTSVGQFIGTPGYVAPEQIQNQRVDQRADIYSIGCLLFRCLTGRPVFEDENVLEMLVRVTRERATSVAELRPDLSPRLCELVDRALEREPIDRQENVEELLEAFELFSGELGDPTRLPPRLESPEARAKADHSTAGASAPTSLEAAPVARPAIAAARRIRLGVAVAVTLALGLSAVAVVGLATKLVTNGTSARGTGAVSPSLSATASATNFGPKEERIGKEARSAWGTIRIGARSAAMRKLQVSAKSDKASASEQLWLALLTGPGDAGQRAYRNAGARTAELTEFERAVADAAGPLFATPTDFAGVDTTLAELARSAESAELWIVLGRLRTQMNAESSARAAEDEVANAGWPVAAAVERIYVPREFFDFEESGRHAKECVDRWHDAVDCLATVTRYEGIAGNCAAMEADARAWIKTDPDDPYAYEHLAFALAALGEGDPALLEALGQKWTRLPESERISAQRSDELRLDGFRGRFESAKARAQAAVDAFPPDAPLVMRLASSFGPILVAGEIGDEAHMREVTRGVLERASAATPTNPSEAALFLLFASIGRRFVAQEHRWKGMVETAFARYEAYLASQGGNLRPYQRLMPWIVGYAAGVKTDADAKEAYAAMGRYEPLPPPGREDDVDLVIGNVLYQNGEVKRALPYLRRPARSCLALENPYAVFRARKVLGQALEADGDVEGAKAAYESALAAWGESKPKSLTAEYARKRLDVLARPKPR